MDDCIVQHQHLQAEPYLVMVQRIYVGMGFGPLPEPTARQTSGEVSARINHGRWIVDCVGCNSAMIIDLAELIYMCPECGNSHNDGKWIKVLLPADRKAIENELLKRPWNGRNPADAGGGSRNWEPGETVAMLHQENINHGIGDN